MRDLPEVCDRAKRVKDVNWCRSEPINYRSEDIDEGGSWPYEEILIMTVESNARANPNKKSLHHRPYRLSITPCWEYLDATTYFLTTQHHINVPSIASALQDDTTHGMAQV